METRRYVIHELKKLEKYNYIPRLLQDMKDNVDPERYNTILKCLSHIKKNEHYSECFITGYMPWDNNKYAKIFFECLSIDDK